MKQDKFPTLVIFRVWRDSGSVIALFPEVPHDPSGLYCSSYEHVGQHGAADAHGVVRHSRPAKPKEWRPLARELRRIGYRLRIGSRVPRNALATRRAAL